MHDLFSNCDQINFHAHSNCSSTAQQWLLEAEVLIVEAQEVAVGGLVVEAPPEGEEEAVEEEDMDEDEDKAHRTRAAISEPLEFKTSGMSDQTCHSTILTTTGRLPI